MAGTVRDLFLAVRVTDRATGPLRRISSDLRRLQGGGAAGAAAQRDRLMAQTQALQMQRRATAAELHSVTAGKQRKALDDAQRAHATSLASKRAKLAEIDNSLLKNQAAQTAGAIRLAKAQAAYNAAAGGGGRISPEEAAARLRVARLSQQALINGETNLQRKYVITENELANKTVAEQSLIAKEAELGARAQFLTTKLANQGDAIAANGTKISQLNAAEQAYLKQENLAKWSQRARVIEHIGHSLTLLGLAATAAFGLAAKGAATFQTQATLAATQARPTGQSAAATARISPRLQNIVLRQMKEFPASAEEMNKALYDIFSGTKITSISKAAALLRIFNKEAVAGGTDLDTMAQAGITLFNNFPSQFANATVAGDKFFAMVRYGRGNAQQFAQALNPIIPIAQQAGQSFDDVSTTLAFLSRQSRDVTQNAQGYARVLLLLARPEVRAGFKKLGISVTDSHGRIRSLLDITRELKQRLPHMTPVESLTFFKTISQAATGRGTAGTIQGARVWSRLLQGVEQYGKVTRDVLKDQGEFQKSFIAMKDAPAVKWQVFINQLHVLAYTIGAEAIPAFGMIGKQILRAIKWFDELSPSTKHAIGYFGALIAVATLLGGVFITLVGGALSLVFTLRLLMGSRGLAGISSEAGMISVRFAMFSSAAIVLFLILSRYPGILSTVVRDLGGLRNALELLAFAMLARGMLTRFGIFRMIGAEAVAATGLVAGLRLALLRLGLIGTVAITIDVLVNKQSRDDFINSLKHPKELAKVALGGIPTLLTGGRWKPWQNEINKGNLDMWANRVNPATNRQMQQQFNPLVQMGQAAKRNRREADNSSKAYRQAGNAARSMGVQATASFKQLYAILVATRRAALAAQRALQISPTAANSAKALKAWTAYENALTNLRANATKQQSAAAVRSLSGIDKASNDAAQKQKDRLDQQKQDYQDTLDAIHSMYQELLQQNQGIFGQLFQGPLSALIQFRKQWGVMPRAQDLIGDIQGQVTRFRKFEGALGTLRRKGAPTELINQLRSAGIEALPEIEVLARMQPKQWRTYMNAFKAGQKLIKQQTWHDLQDQLALYRKFGKNVGEAIRDGIASETPQLKSEIKALVLKMFPELKGGGAATRGTQPPGGGPKTEKHTHYHDHTTVHTHKGESVDGALAKHRNRMRNRPHYGH